MRVAIGTSRDITDRELRLASQMGCSGVVVPTPAAWSGRDRWDADDIARLRDRIEGFGLRLESLQNTPPAFLDPFRLGTADADRALEAYRHTVRAVGKAGVPILGYNWRPNQVYRTGHVAGRGGATFTAFDVADSTRPLSHEREYPADELWATFDRFAREILPVAADAGVRLALHPDDPPGFPIGGVARIMSSLEGYERARGLAQGSPAWSLLFCLGCWSEIGGNDYALHALETYASRGEIAYVHFRDVIGTVERFQECFLGEGNVDIAEAIRILHRHGFDGCLIDDHVPHMEGDGDAGWPERGHAWSTGYLLGLIRGVTGT